MVTPLFINFALSHSLSFSLSTSPSLSPFPSILPSPLTELLGTPGYLAPEMLKRSVNPDEPGYGKEIDM